MRPVWSRQRSWRWQDPESVMPATLHAREARHRRTSWRSRVRTFPNCRPFAQLLQSSSTGRTGSMDCTKRVADALAALVALAVVSAAAQRDTIHKIGLFDTTNSQLAKLVSFKAMPLAAADFGAKCDAVTNDAPAINAALTEAGHMQFASLGAGSQIV